MGNEYNAESNTVVTSQRVCPFVLGRMSEAIGKPGQDIMHEVTESYEGGKMALENKKGDSTPGKNNRYYEEAHKRATPQTPVETTQGLNWNYEYYRPPRLVPSIYYYVYNNGKPILIYNERLN